MKEEGPSVEGVVTEECGNARFKIVLANGEYVIARVAGKLSQKNIRVQVNDTVVVELCPYDLHTGRITFRYKKAQI